MKTCILLLIVLLLATNTQARKMPLSIGVYGWGNYSTIPFGIRDKFYKASGSMNFVKGVKLSAMHKGFEIGVGLEQGKMQYRYNSSNSIPNNGNNFRTDAVYVSPYLFADHSILRIGNNYFYGGLRLGHMAFLSVQTGVGWGNGLDYYDTGNVLHTVPATTQKNTITIGTYAGYNVILLPRLCLQAQAGLTYVPVSLSYLDIQEDGLNITRANINTSFLQVPFTLGIIYHFGKHSNKNEQRDTEPETKEHNPKDDR